MANLSKVAASMPTRPRRTVRLYYAESGYTALQPLAGEDGKA